MAVSEVFGNVEIIRTSTRFINRFLFDDFENPEEYFTSLITSTVDRGLPYPLQQYNFRLVMDMPDSNMYAIVNHEASSFSMNKYMYTLDIDVLSRERIIFDKDAISAISDKLREKKNELFFGSITKKTEDLCR